MEDYPIRPFKVDIPRNEVDRLKAKLADTRLPGRSIVPEAGDRYGPRYDWAVGLVEAWKAYDWYAVQDEMNAFPHYLTEIEGLDIHFLHAKSAKKSAIPLLMIHGWPGSFWEFSQVWTKLSNPETKEDQAFHVVAPSMPGFCWSSWPPRSGWTLKDNARIFDKLMARLGYERYMVQCGDWGYFVGRELGAQYTDRCKLLHVNFAPSPFPEGLELTERESAVKARVDDWLENHMGYAVCMRSRPHTIGIALHDNPVGILMWVGEKYNEAANPENQANPFWEKAILTTASLYFFSGCIMPSMLPYYENGRHDKFAEYAMQPENRIKIPFGYTSHLWDTEPSCKRAVERTGNLVFYRDRDNGGHFAALECPEGLIDDLRTLAGQEWREA